MISRWLVCCLPVLALPQTRVDVDTLVQGVVHRHIRTSDPLSIHLLEVDLRIATIRFASYRPKGLVRLSEQFESVRTEFPTTFAGVNADFFSYATGQPIGNQVSNGEIVSAIPSQREHFTVDNLGRPGFQPMVFSGLFWKKGAIVDTIHTIDQPYDGPGVALYSHRWFDSVSIGLRRKTIRANLLATQLRVGVKLQFVLIPSVQQRTDSLANNQYLFSFPNDSGLPSNIDTISVLLSFRGPAKLNDAVGGGGRILRSSSVIDSISASKEGLNFQFVTSRHPRTFIAFSRDTLRILLGTVDGRQASSRGMNLLELAEFLLEQGYSDALNFDGGGSTTMIIGGRIVNAPSDKSGERKVANGLFLSKK